MGEELESNDYELEQYEEHLSRPCPECRQVVNLKLLGNVYDPRNSQTPPDDEFVGECRRIHLLTAICPRCGTPFFLRAEWVDYPDAIASALSDVEQIAPVSGSVELEGAPRELVTSWVEAERCIDAGCYRAAVLMCRLVLEGMCETEGATEKDLYKKLERLRIDGKLDKRLSDWATEIRLLGNDAAHRSLAVIEHDDAVDILELTRAIIVHVYVMEARHRRYRERRKDQ